LGLSLNLTLILSQLPRDGVTLVLARGNDSDRGILVSHTQLRAVLGFLFLAACATVARAQGVDTSFSLPTQRPLLCRRITRIDAKVKLTAPGSEETSPHRRENELVFVDEHEVLTRQREEVTRTIVKSIETTNGKVTDPPLSGVRLQYERNDEAMSLRLLDDRMLPQAKIDSLLESRYTLGLWLDLPKSARVGATYRVDLTFLASVLIQSPEPVRAPRAMFKFLRYDASTGVATFNGDLRLIESGFDGTHHFVATYDLQGDLKVHPTERRIVSLELKGTVKVRGEAGGAAKMQGKGTCEIDLTTSIDDAVDQALARKPVFRPKPFEFPELDVRCTLPSQYARLPSKVLENALLRTVDGQKGKVLIQAALAKGDTDDVEAQLDGVVVETLKAFADLKIQSVASKLGKGRAFTFSRQRPDGTHETVRAEWYPYREGLYFIYQVAADPRLYRDALREFAAGRRTLRRISDG